MSCASSTGWSMPAFASSTSLWRMSSKARWGEPPPWPPRTLVPTGFGAHLLTAVCLLQVFAEKMGLETGWNCHISLTPNGDMPGSEIPPSSPSHAGSLHDDLNQGEGKGLWWGQGGCGGLPPPWGYSRKSPIEPS